ncbi:hypothetical protein EVAR_38986_1 [Eumeta japonica]|uniref:Uncharacterized protein n=1 Tax=Eumeta variegata TaxID=151549 RepID=A0A4C1WB64_EUMVA|nr:hypothetical protein EVAR_38986_1 [Eumeta japonica]
MHTHNLQYNARNFAAVNFVTKALQWRKIGTRRRRRKGWGAWSVISFAASSERQSFVRCPAYTMERQRRREGAATSRHVTGKIARPMILSTLTHRRRVELCELSC